MNVLLMVSLLGVSPSTTYHLASSKLSVSQIAGTSLYIGVGGTLLAGIIGYSIIHLPVEFFKKATKVEFMYAIAVVSPHLFCTYAIAILRGTMRYVTMNCTKLLSSLVTATGTLFLCVLFKFGVRGALMAGMLGPATAVLWTLVVFRKEISINEAVKSFRYVPSVLHYGMRAYFSYFAQSLNIQLGVLVMGFFLLKSEVGFYAIALAIATRIEIIPGALYEVLMPRLAKNRSQSADLLCRALRVIMIAVSTGAIVLGLICRPLVRFAFGEEYLPVVGVTYTLLVGVVLRSAGKVVTTYFFAVDRPGINSITKLFGLVINVISLMVLIPIYGLRGGAVGTTLSYSLEAIIMLAAFYWVSKVNSWKMLLPGISDFLAFKNLVVSIIEKACLNKNWKV
jgi:O-antigen/teichoic acid export membrane protein